MKYEAHELANLFPRMNEAEFKELVSDVRRNGLISPITIFEGKILDGIHRQDACHEAKIDPEYVEYDGDDPIGFVISTNLARRHLSESERSMVAARLVVKRAKHKSVPIGTRKTQRKQQFTKRKAAKLLKVGERSVSRAKKVIERGDTALQQAVERGAIKLAPAAEIAALPKLEQPAAIKRHAAQTHRKHAHKPATVLDLNAAWNRSDFEQRRRFVDGVGCQAIWNVMPEHQREAMFTLISHENQELPAAVKTSELPDDLSIPQFLRRN